MDFSATLGFLSSSTDWVILSVVAFVLALDAFRSGTSRAVSIALSVPAAMFALASIEVVPFLSGLTAQLSTPLLQAGLALALFIMFFLLIGRMTYSYGDGAGRIIVSLIAGMAATVALALFWVQVPAFRSLWDFGPAVDSAFGPAYQLLWLLGSYAALAFVRR